VRFRDGREGGYIRLIHAAGSPGAAVLPFYRGDILLLKHFRHTTRTWHWEIPRGFASAGETPMETASREATEELGVSPERLRRVGGIHTDTGLTPAVVELFVADVRSLGSPERTEGIDLIQAVSPARFDDMARTGEVTDSFTIAAVALARLHGLI
jgi:ADP-ribose pyrophosphatase